jgi:hypothetical protein
MEGEFSWVLGNGKRRTEARIGCGRTGKQNLRQVSLRREWVGDGGGGGGGVGGGGGGGRVGGGGGEKKIKKKKKKKIYNGGGGG